MKTIHEIAHDTVVLAGRIGRMEPGEQISYAELMALVGHGPNRFRSCLASARRVALRENGVVTGCVRGVGIKRLSAGEIAGVGDAAIASIQRRSSRACKIMRRGAEVVTLDNDATVALHSRMAVLGTLRAFTEAKTLPKVEKAVRDNKLNHLSMQQTLAAWNG